MCNGSHCSYDSNCASGSCCILYSRGTAQCIDSFADCNDYDYNDYGRALRIELLCAILIPIIVIIAVIITICCVCNRLRRKRQQDLVRMRNLNAAEYAAT